LILAHKFARLPKIIICYRGLVIRLRIRHCYLKIKFAKIRFSSLLAIGRGNYLDNS
jgi:hypothetical protein